MTLALAFSAAAGRWRDEAIAQTQAFEKSLAHFT
jgi:hypothetical protein